MERGRQCKLGACGNILQSCDLTGDELANKPYVSHRPCMARDKRYRAASPLTSTRRVGSSATRRNTTQQYGAHVSRTRTQRMDVWQSIAWRHIVLDRETGRVAANAIKLGVTVAKRLMTADSVHGWHQDMVENQGPCASCKYE